MKPFLYICSRTAALALYLGVGTFSLNAFSASLSPPPTDQAAFTASTGVIPSSQVQVFASGAMESASLNVLLPAPSQINPLPINVYVAARVPAGVLGLTSVTWFQRIQTGWTALTVPMGALYVGISDASQTLPISVPILQSIDISMLADTEIYIGYGTSDTEMLAANRYRGIYKVIDPFGPPPSPR